MWTAWPVRAAGCGPNASRAEARVALARVIAPIVPRDAAARGVDVVTAAHVPTSPGRHFSGGVARGLRTASADS